MRSRPLTELPWSVTTTSTSTRFALARSTADGGVDSVEDAWGAAWATEAAIAEAKMKPAIERCDRTEMPKPHWQIGETSGCAFRFLSILLQVGAGSVKNIA